MKFVITLIMICFATVAKSSGSQYPHLMAIQPQCNKDKIVDTEIAWKRWKWAAKCTKVTTDKRVAEYISGKRKHKPIDLVIRLKEIRGGGSGVFSGNEQPQNSPSSPNSFISAITYYPTFLLPGKQGSEFEALKDENAPCEIGGKLVILEKHTPVLCKVGFDFRGFDIENILTDQSAFDALTNQYSDWEL